MKKVVFISSVLLLLIINGVTLFRFYQLKLHIENAVSENSSELHYNEELDSYKSNFANNLINYSLKIDNLLIKDTLSNTVLLKSLFKKNQKRILVCRFSQYQCESCVDFSIQSLSYMVDSIGNVNVVFLGNYRNNRNFSSTIPLYGIQGRRVFNSPEINIPLEQLKFPYYFVLDSNLSVSNVFIPDKAVPKITKIYLQNILHAFN